MAVNWGFISDRIRVVFTGSMGAQEASIFFKTATTAFLIMTSSILVNSRPSTLALPRASPPKNVSIRLYTNWLSRTIRPWPLNGSILNTWRLVGTGRLLTNSENFKVSKGLALTSTLVCSKEERVARTSLESLSLMTSKVGILARTTLSWLVKS